MSKLTLSFKGQVLKIFPVHNGTISIGSDPSCDIHVDSLAIEPQHAQIDTEQQASRLKALSQENGTFIKNEKIDAHQLNDGDTFTIGKHTLTYTFEEVSEEEMLQAINNSDNQSGESSQQISFDPAEDIPEVAIEISAPKKQDGWLQIMSGQNLGKTLSLHRSMTNLGKPGLATAVIAHRESGYFISQLEGKSPLQINSQPTEHPTRLNTDDIIQIGNVKMQFYLE